MTTFTASVDVKPMAKSLKNYQRKKLPAVIQQALNRAIKGVVTDAVQNPRKVVKERINMKAGEIRKRLETTKAQKGSGFASVKVKGKKPPNLISFGAKAKGKSIGGKRRLAGKGITVRAWEKRKLYKGTFVAPVGTSGGPRNIVVARVKGSAKVIPGKGRYVGKVIKRGPRAGQPIKRQPLKAIFGPSLQSIFRRKTRTGESPVKILGRLGKGRLEEEIARRLKSLQLK